MKKIFFTILFLSSVTMSWAQGIIFVDLPFSEALAKAKAENKILFIDMYADWCGPCKMLSEQVFVLPTVGEYYNSKFISIKLNVDLKENESIAQKYDVKGLPTLLYLDGDGKIVNTMIGAGDAYAVLRSGRLAMKEQPTEDQMYEQYKKNPKDLSCKKNILIDAPYFIVALVGSNQERWAIRVEDIFNEYVAEKGLENMINVEDFNILAMFHRSMKKNDKIINFIVSNYDKISQFVDPKIIAQYVGVMHTGHVIDLTRKKDIDYQNVLLRMTGDMRPIYGVLSENVDEYYSMYKYFSDANFEIYSNKSVSGYIENMDKYISLIKQPLAKDYFLVIQTLFDATSGKMNKDGYTKSILWIDDALRDKDIAIDLHVNLVIVMGDCFAGLKNIEKAKECYNQAYMISLKANDANFATQVRQVTNSKSVELGE